MKFLNLERRIIPNHKQRSATKKGGGGGEGGGGWEEGGGKWCRGALCWSQCVWKGFLVAAWLWFLFIGPGNHIPGVFEALIFTK